MYSYFMRSNSFCQLLIAFTANYLIKIVAFVPEGWN